MGSEKPLPSALGGVTIQPRRGQGSAPRLATAYPVANVYSQSLGFLLDCTMPTALRIGGLRVPIYPNDHPPPHVHVIGAKGEAVFLLDCPGGPAELRESFGFNGPEIRQMAAGLLGHILALCTEWEPTRGNL